MKCVQVIPPLIVALLVGTLYSVFVAYNLLPQWERVAGRRVSSNVPFKYKPSFEELLGVTIGFHVCFLLFLISYFRAALTEPGAVPEDDERWASGKFNIDRESEEKLVQIIKDTSYEGEKLEKERAFLKSMPVIERKSNNKGVKIRSCNSCGVYKPDRTHHCRICGRCVLRMDHHCPWLVNCIGFHNHKYFLLALFYAAACCAFILGDMARRLIVAFRPVLDTSTFVLGDLPVIVAYFLAGFLFLALFPFFCFHVSLAARCLTTIELREKRNNDKDNVRHRWLVANMKYDRGSMYRNFCHLFGPPWMWLLPLESTRLDTDGTYAEVPYAPF